MRLRASVKWFAEYMELKLKKNDYKGGWHNATLQYLTSRLGQEKMELHRALKKKDHVRVLEECVDVANFCMMISERVSILNNKQVNVSRGGVNHVEDE